MMKRLIMGSLIVCCMILVTAKGSVFARRLGEDKKLNNVILASQRYNMKMHDKKIELKHTDPDSCLEYKIESINGKSGDCLQGLIMAPIVIMKTIGDNPVFFSR